MGLVGGDSVQVSVLSGRKAAESFVLRTDHGPRRTRPFRKTSSEKPDDVPGYSLKMVNLDVEYFRAACCVLSLLSVQRHTRAVVTAVINGAIGRPCIHLVAAQRSCKSVRMTNPVLSALAECSLRQ